MCVHEQTIDYSYIFGIYDIIIVGKQLANIKLNLNLIVEFKEKISNKFRTKDLGEASYVLKIKTFKLSDGSWKLSQHNYIDNLIQLYSLNNEKSVDLPIQPNHKLTLDLSDEKNPLKEPVDSKAYRQAIGRLMYLMVCTRPDISYAVSCLSRFMSAPKEKHWRCVKQLLRYIKSTRDYALVYPKNGSTILTGYCDSDHAGDLGDRKSTSGYLFKLSECVISWKSVKQKTVAIS